MVAVSISVSAPPEPVLPPSSIDAVSVTSPSKSRGGAKLSCDGLARYALISAIVPDSVSELVPPPVTLTLPPATALSVPASTLNATVTMLPPASTSETEIPSNETDVSSSVDQLGGSAMSGGSLTGVTVILTTSTSDNGPPEPVLPSSSTVIVNGTVPKKSAAGAK